LGCRTSGRSPGSRPGLPDRPRRAQPGRAAERRARGRDRRAVLDSQGEERRVMDATPPDAAIGAFVDFVLTQARRNGTDRGGDDDSSPASPVPELPADEVPPFPLETLPGAFRALVEEGAASLVAPPDFIAVPLLVAAGSAIGSALLLELKPGWREGANLYAA